MKSDFELRILRLEACDAIRSLIARYAIGADRKNDPAILGPLFAENGMWQADGLTSLCGRETIAQGLSDLAREFVTWSIHYMVSPLIEVSHDAMRATCRWYLWELCTMNQGGDGEGAADTWYGGWYDSRLSKHGDAWLFDWVHLQPRLASANTAPWTGKVTDDPRNLVKLAAS